MDAPLLIFWSAEAAWCGLWRHANGFELRLRSAQCVVRSQRFADPAAAFHVSRAWRREIELQSAAAALRRQARDPAGPSRTPACPDFSA